MGHKQKIMRLQKLLLCQNVSHIETGVAKENLNGLS